MAILGKRSKGQLKLWLFKGSRQSEGPHEQEGQHQQHSWWQVMCLTGVDYFSTLGYQPGIAFLAAGALSPLATLVLVLLTLLGALPIYNRVANESPHGEGSIAMLEHLLSRWKGKLFVLMLLGFVATDFIITITLSAADATAHAIENPFVQRHLTFLDHPIAVTLALIALLGAIFIRGFKEAIGIAVLLVGVYLLLNVVVIGTGLYHLLTEQGHLLAWKNALWTYPNVNGNPFLMIGLALLLFPKLALGLSGFETGVAVMPLVRGDKDLSDEDWQSIHSTRTDRTIPPSAQALLEGRIHNTRKLLRTAALIMSVLLIASSIVTATLIRPEQFQEGGEASGRALAYLAHTFLGEWFGSVYDLSTILILWFAGASAMAGLLNIVPRYLPRYGMAPDWARATRPLVLVYTAIAFAVTIIFKANVEAQGGAYATGVLVLMRIILTSLISRVWRSTELRVDRVELDEEAQKIIDEASKGTVRIVANRCNFGSADEYRIKENEKRADNHIPSGEPIIFLEVIPGDASEFAGVLKVKGGHVDGFRILRTESPAVPNAIAAFLLHLRDKTGKLPHIYFGWSEGNPLYYLLKYVAFGEGDTAPVTHEVLRQAEEDPERRPNVHVGG
ncbi:MAG: amino acid transporter [Acidobacteria bacterium]|nr:MAG: amino acid transporter [Acidobacteriota bacterium]